MALIVTYERLTVPQLFQKASDVFRHRLRVFLTLSTLVTLPMMLFGVAMSSYAFASLTDVMSSFQKLSEDQTSMMIDAGMDAGQSSSSSSSTYGNYQPAYDPTAASDKLQADMYEIVASLFRHVPFFLTIIVVQTTVFSVLTIAGRGAMIRATAELFVNVDAEPQWMDCFHKGLGRFWALFCAGILLSFGFLTLYGVPVLMFYGGYVGLGVLMFIIFPFALVYCSVRFALVFPSIVIENLSAMEGVKRSWELSQNAFCDVFGVMFSAGFCIVIVSNIVLKLVVGMDPVAPFRPLGIATQKMLGLFVMPYMAM